MSQSSEGELQVTLKGNIYRTDFFLLRKMRVYKINKLISIPKETSKFLFSYKMDFI